MIGNPIEPYTIADAKADALRLYANPDDTDLLAEVDARLHATLAVFDTTDDTIVDPNGALGAQDARNVAIELLFAATQLEIRRSGLTERQVRARVTRKRNAEAKKEAAADARRSTSAPFDVDRVSRDRRDKPPTEPEPTEPDEDE